MWKSAAAAAETPGEHCPRAVRFNRRETSDVVDIARRTTIGSRRRFTAARRQIFFFA